MLAPIARLLGITTDTLLSFRETLSSEEIAAYVKKLDQDLETREYAEVFGEAKKTLEEYPNCDQLVWQAAVILQARRNIDEIPDKENYDDVIFGWLERCLQSEDGKIRKEAAGSLFYAYLRKEEYEKARSYLSYLAVDSPERKRKVFCAKIRRVRVVLARTRIRRITVIKQLAARCSFLGEKCRSPPDLEFAQQSDFRIRRKGNEL